MATARIKNWQQFQHYKDRSPPWVKLHRALLDDFSFSSLPLASKALAPMLWLLAAENMEGEINSDPVWLAFRLRWPLKDVKAGLSALFHWGFLVDASSVLATCLQPATPETETETETETKTPFARQGERFSEFYTAYPRKAGRKPAEAKWKAKRLDAQADAILADVATRKRTDRKWLDNVIPNPATYLNQERWLDDPDTPVVPSAARSAKPAGPSETPLERAVAYARQQHGYGAIDLPERDRLIGVATEKYREAQ